VIKRQTERNEDSTDIKWCAALNRFIGVTTFDRFSTEATVRVYQSTDQSGLTFQTTPYIGARVQQGTHNIGLSGSTAGWISLESRTNFVAYAYQPEGSGWGNWPTFLTPVNIVSLPDSTVIDGQVSSCRDWSWSGPFAWDGNPTTVWSSASNQNESLTIHLGDTFSVNSLVLAPRPPSGYGFPLKFSILASNDSQHFTPILDYAYSSYTETVTCTFPNPVNARYFQVMPITYGTDEQGKTVFQLAEISAQFQWPIAVKVWV
jgi:F5/8 type C domain